MAARIRACLRAVLAATAAALITIVGVAPCADAAYNDVSDVSPAYRNLPEYGDPIYGGEIPDGTYLVDANTDSRMCIFYATQQDGENNANKNKAYITVHNGTITVDMWISKMYTRIFYGSAEDAVKYTDEDGTYDAPEYEAGDPAEGYVPHYHQFQIAGLNVPMQFAAYSGAQSEVNRRMWYARYVVFTPTDEVLEAIARAHGGNSGGDEDDEPGGESGQDKDTQGGSTGGAGGSEKQGSSGDSRDDETPQQVAPLGVGAGNGDAGSGGGTGSGVGRGSESGQAVNKQSATGIPGKALSIVGVDTLGYNEDAGGGKEMEALEVGGLLSNVPLLIGVLATLLLAAGMVARVLGFKHAFGKPEDLP